jgi:hypothetical protein
LAKTRVREIAIAAPLAMTGGAEPLAACRYDVCDATDRTEAFSSVFVSRSLFRLVFAVFGAFSMG